jgi:hypothetical protein
MLSCSLAQNCPGQLGIRITGFRITEGPLLARKNYEKTVRVVVGSNML